MSKPFPQPKFRIAFETVSKYVLLIRMSSAGQGLRGGHQAPDRARRNTPPPPIRHWGSQASREDRSSPSSAEEDLRGEDTPNPDVVRAVINEGPHSDDSEEGRINGGCKGAQ